MAMKEMILHLGPEHVRLILFQHLKLKFDKSFDREFSYSDFDFKFDDRGACSVQVESEIEL